MHVFALHCLKCAVLFLNVLSLPVVTPTRTEEGSHCGRLACLGVEMGPQSFGGAAFFLRETAEARRVWFCPRCCIERQQRERAPRLNSALGPDLSVV